MRYAICAALIVLALPWVIVFGLPLSWGEQPDPYSVTMSIAFDVFLVVAGILAFCINKALDTL